MKRTVVYFLVMISITGSVVAGNPGRVRGITTDPEQRAFNAQVDKVLDTDVEQLDNNALTAHEALVGQVMQQSPGKRIVPMTRNELNKKTAEMNEAKSKVLVSELPFWGADEAEADNTTQRGKKEMQSKVSPEKINKDTREKTRKGTEESAQIAVQPLSQIKVRQIQNTEIQKVKKIKNFPPRTYTEGEIVPVKTGSFILNPNLLTDADSAIAKVFSDNNQQALAQTLQKHIESFNTALKGYKENAVTDALHDIVLLLLDNAFFKKNSANLGPSFEQDSNTLKHLSAFFIGMQCEKSHENKKECRKSLAFIMTFKPSVIGVGAGEYTIQAILKRKSKNIAQISSMCNYLYYLQKDFQASDFPVSLALAIAKNLQLKDFNEFGEYKTFLEYVLPTLNARAADLYNTEITFLDRKYSPQTQNLSVLRIKEEEYPELFLLAKKIDICLNQLAAYEEQIIKSSVDFNAVNRQIDDFVNFLMSSNIKDPLLERVNAALPERVKKFTKDDAGLFVLFYNAVSKLTGLNNETMKFIYKQVRYLYQQYQWYANGGAVKSSDDELVEFLGAADHNATDRIAQLTTKAGSTVPATPAPSSSTTAPAKGSASTASGGERITLTPKKDGCIRLEIEQSDGEPYFNFVQFSSMPQQTNKGCGYYSIANAAAINEYYLNLKNQEVVHGNDIKQLIKDKYGAILKAADELKQEPTTLELLSVISDYKRSLIASDIDIRVYEGSPQNNNLFYDVERFPKAAENIDQANKDTLAGLQQDLVKAIKGKSRKTFHLILLKTVGENVGHFVLLSIVIDISSFLEMYYMDPMNGPLTADNNITAQVTAIYKTVQNAYEQVPKSSFPKRHLDCEFDVKDWVNTLFSVASDRQKKWSSGQLIGYIDQLTPQLKANKELIKKLVDEFSSQVGHVFFHSEEKNKVLQYYGISTE